MGKGFFEVFIVVNEFVKDYVLGFFECEEVFVIYKKMFNSIVDVLLYINGRNIKIGDIL